MSEEARFARGALLTFHLSTTHNLAIFLDFMPLSAFAAPVESRLSTEIVVQCFSYSASISRNSSAEISHGFHVFRTPGGGGLWYINCNEGCSLSPAGCSGLTAYQESVLMYSRRRARSRRRGSVRIAGIIVRSLAFLTLMAACIAAIRWISQGSSNNAELFTRLNQSTPKTTS